MSVCVSVCHVRALTFESLDPGQVTLAEMSFKRITKCARSRVVRFRLSFNLIISMLYILVLFHLLCCCSLSCSVESRLS